MLTLKDALDVLRIDSGVNDELVQQMLEAIPDLIETTTGMSIAQQETEPLVNTVSRFIITLWYYGDHSDSTKLQTVIDSLMKTITLRAGQPQVE